MLSRPISGSLEGAHRGILTTSWRMEAGPRSPKMSGRPGAATHCWTKIGRSSCIGSSGGREASYLGHTITKTEEEKTDGRAATTEYQAADEGFINDSVIRDAVDEQVAWIMRAHMADAMSTSRCGMCGIGASACGRQLPMRKARRRSPAHAQAGEWAAAARPSRSAVVQDVIHGTPPFAGDVGPKVDEWIEENLRGYLAPSTTKQYSGIYGKWRAWARRQGWDSEFLNKAEKVEENEDKILGFLGYVGWLGASVATLKQAIFAIKDAHKRGGQGDPTDKMFRLWMLLNALEKRHPKKARRLGVTPEMLKWVADSLNLDDAGSGERFDAMMLLCAISTAWFFMLRAKEYCDSNGIDEAMIFRGTDVKFVTEEANVVGVTIQFRKTKTDQDAFGTCKTMYESGVQGDCVVQALKAFKDMAPQRFGQGREALKPLFRWGSGQVVKRIQIQNTLQRAAVAVGLPPERFLSHSLRIGGASALFQGTGEIELVKRTGRWSSSAVQRYLHDGEVALEGVAAKMANVQQQVHYKLAPCTSSFPMASSSSGGSRLAMQLVHLAGREIPRTKKHGRPQNP